MSNNRVKLRIAGSELTLLTNKSEDYVKELAAKLESELLHMYKAGVTKDKAVMMCALNYLDESTEKSDQLNIEKTKNDECFKEVNDLKEQVSLLDGSKEELLELKRQIKLFISQNESLKKQLSEISSENDRLKKEIVETKDKVNNNDNNIKPVMCSGELKNPMRPQLNFDGMIDFYEKKD